MPKTNYAAKALIGAAAAMAAAARRKSGSATNSTTTRSVRTMAARRHRGGSRTVTRRNTRETAVPAAEYTRNSTAIGRKPKHTLRAAWKLLDQNKQSVVYGYRNYSAFGGTAGTMSLGNVSATPTTGAMDVPLHMWDLTGCINNVNGGIVAPGIYSRPKFDTPNSPTTVSWVNDGIGSLNVENSDGVVANGQNYPMGSDTLDWVQAKLLFYCPTTLPCRFQIDVVQLKDTRLVPVDATPQPGFQAAFYQALVKKFAYSPLEPCNYKMNKYLKVLHTQTFILNPKESTEAVNTIFREVNIFLRLNRRCTYDWNDKVTTSTLASSIAAETGQDIATTVHPRARIFLMIRGQARNNNTFSSLIMPSYDIALRMKHSNFSG